MCFSFSPDTSGKLNPPACSRWYFNSQQSAEKAVKAVHYGSGERFVTGHSIFKLLSTLQQKVSGDIIEKAKVLDQFYIAARYPNGLPGGAPYEVFTQSQANEALEHAQQVYAWAHNELKG